VVVKQSQDSGTPMLYFRNRRREIAFRNATLVGSRPESRSCTYLDEVVDGVSPKGLCDRFVA